MLYHILKEKPEIVILTNFNLEYSIGNQNFEKGKGGMLQAMQCRGYIILKQCYMPFRSNEP